MTVEHVKKLAVIGLLFAASALLSMPAYADGTAKRPMALVIMTDGLRADTVESGRMPNLEKLRAGKWMPGYKSAWTLAGQVSPGSIPSSAPNHVSIATGYGVPTHGLTSNAQLEAGVFTAKPTWLKRIVDAKPGATVLFVYSWWPDANLYPAEGVEFMQSPTNEDDEPNASALSLRLAGADAPARQPLLPPHGLRAFVLAFDLGGLSAACDRPACSKRLLRRHISVRKNMVYYAPCKR